MAEREMDSPIKVAMIGAGNRASKYAAYLLTQGGRVRIEAVVDPNRLRSGKIALQVGLGDDACFESVDRMLAEKYGDIDAVIITTPEQTHYDIAMEVLSRNLPFLIEKPVATDMVRCEAIMLEAKRRGVVAGVCHVLRYHPYFRAIRDIVVSGELGRLVSVSHRVRVGLDRTAHTFVRGPWGREDLTAPMMLTKCCHDIDFLLWIAGSEPRRWNSFGSKRWFGPENAPEGASERCVGCGVESDCPFSAVDLYRRRGEWTANFDIPAGDTLDNVVERELSSGPYGRCVYHCGSNVVDRQILGIEFADGAVASLSMDLFTATDCRMTDITLTGGEIHGDERRITVVPFKGTSRTLDFSEIASRPYHAGADWLVVDDFLKAVADPGHRMLANVADSVAGHRICLTSH